MIPSLSPRDLVCYAKLLPHEPPNEWTEAQAVEPCNRTGVRDAHTLHRPSEFTNILHSA